MKLLRWIRGSIGIGAVSIVILNSTAVGEDVLDDGSSAISMPISRSNVETVRRYREAVLRDIDRLLVFAEKADLHSWKLTPREPQSPSQKFDQACEKVLSGKTTNIYECVEARKDFEKALTSRR